MGQLIKRVPIPMAGLMLALASAGNLLLSYGALYRNLLGGIAAILFLLLTIKVLTDPKGVNESLENPVVASVSPTFSMGMMILSTYVKPYSATFAYGMWLLAIFLHILLIVNFTRRFILNFNMKKVFPSYFVVYVGIVVGSVTAPAHNQAIMGQYLFWFGFVSYLVLLPIVLYRVIKIKEIPEAALPTLAIFAAPGSLCLAGYMNSFQNKNMVIVGFLGTLSLLMLGGVILYLPKLLKLPFYPSYAAFTFPLVISAMAMKLTNGFLMNRGTPIPWLKLVVQFEELLAISMVIYVLLRYIQFLFPSVGAKAPASNQGKVV